VILYEKDGLWATVPFSMRAGRGRTFFHQASERELAAAAAPPPSATLDSGADRQAHLGGFWPKQKIPKKRMRPVDAAQGRCTANCWDPSDGAF